MTVDEDKTLRVVSNLLQKVRFCCNSIRNSTTLRENLEVIQIQNINSVLEPISDVKTQWNSTFLMIERYIQIHSDVLYLLRDPEFNDIRINDQELENLKVISDLFSNFLDATIVLSTETTSTASQVIPMFKTLLNHSIAYKATRSFGKNLQSCLVKSIQFYTKKYEIIDNLDLITLTFLDARLKDFRFFPPEERASYISRATKHVKETASRLNLITEAIVKFLN
jgi:hypothetical protein